MEAFLLPKVRKQFRKNIGLKPELLVVLGLIIVLLLTTIGGIANYNYELDKKAAGLSNQTVITAKQALEAKNDRIKTEASKRGQNNPVNDSGGLPAQNSTSITPSSQNPGNTPGSGSNQPASDQVAAKTINVYLSVNGASQGTVKIKSGQNQCQVLRAALAQGIIYDLDMRYYEQYKTEAVYRINGVGDPSKIQWTYTVNGVPPPKGCSLISANNGEVINWQY